MAQISNEGRALAVEYKAGRLTSSREGGLHLSLLSHLVDVTIGGDSEEVAVGVLGRGVERSHSGEHGLAVHDSCIACHLNNSGVVKLIEL